MKTRQGGIDHRRRCGLARKNTGFLDGLNSRDGLLKVFCRCLSLLALLIVSPLLLLVSIPSIVAAADTRGFCGVSPPVADSGATLRLGNLEAGRVFRWTSSDTILGDIDTDFVAAEKWVIQGNPPTRLVFIGTGKGATISGDVLFATFNRAVVDVTKGGKTVRYLLTGLYPEIVDAQAFLPNIAGSISGDPSSPVNASFLRTGAFADGTSVLVMRLQPIDAINQALGLEIRHTNPNPAFPQDAGFVGALGASFPSLPAPDPGSATIGGTSVAFAAGDRKIAFYRPPENFFFGKVPRTQRILLVVKTAEGEVCRKPFDLVRPTLILTHGFTDNGKPGSNVAKLQKIIKTARRQVRTDIFDWGAVNMSGYDVVAALIPGFIAGEVALQRRQGIAATRVDYFGHSMGGVIAKWYVSDIPPQAIVRIPLFTTTLWPGAPYRRSNNFGVGDIRRLVTVGSPFRGSPIADLITLYDIALEVKYPLFLQVLKLVTGVTGDLNAFTDLDSTSATAILSAQKPVISWLPLVGVAGSKRAADLSPPYIKIINLAACAVLPPPANLACELAGAAGFTVSDAALASLGLTPVNSDLVVVIGSQDDATTGIAFFVRNITHSDELVSPGVARLLLQGLDLFFDTPRDPGYFAGFRLFSAGF